MAERSPSDSVFRVTPGADGGTQVEVTCLPSDHDGPCLVKALARRTFPSGQRVIVTRSGPDRWPDAARVVPFHEASAIHLEGGCKL